MTKKLVIVAALMTLGSGAMAQDEGTSSGGGFFSGLSLNTNNKFSVSLMLGNANLFDQDLSYVLPKYGSNYGIGASSSTKSEDPGAYIKLNNLGKGSITNMAGIRFGYYITDGIDVNMSFGMDLRSTPHKNYVENEEVAGLKIEGAKYIEGKIQNNWLLSVGGNYHFGVSNERVDMYAGVQVGYQHGQLTITTPYTDLDYKYLMSDDKMPEIKTSTTKPEVMVNPDGTTTFVYDKGTITEVKVNPDGTLTFVYGDGKTTTATTTTVTPAKENSLDATDEKVDPVLYDPRSKAGQVNCITAAIVAGINYSLTDGLFLGVEFAPYGFQYSLLEVCPKGGRVYQAAHYANRFFANPMLKIGFRF